MKKLFTTTPRINRIGRRAEKRGSISRTETGANTAPIVTPLLPP